MRQEDLVSTIEIRDRNGRVVGTREIVKYPALLNRAHEEGLKRIETSVSQLPAEGNAMTAVAHAIVETEKGIFSASGEASPENTTSRIGRHLISMAETRAKARALRDAVNIGVVSIEEILGEAGNGAYLEAGEAATLPQADHGTVPAQAAPPSTPPAGSPTRRDPMTDSQRRYLFRLLAARGMEAEAAHAFLLKAFEVEGLGEAPKAAASALIDELLAEAMEASSGTDQR